MSSSAQLVSAPVLPSLSQTMPAAALASPVSVLAYVHLRNVHRSTGAGRVARQLVEHLLLRPEMKVHVLADAGDHGRIVPLVGHPWDEVPYHLFAKDTSRQQAEWFLAGRPTARTFWPETEVVFCTGESYVPPGGARLAVTAHDAAYFEPSAHHRDRAFWMQRLRWSLLFGRLSRRADMIHTVSEFSRDRLAHFFPDLAARIRVVPNGVTSHFFAPVAQEGKDFLAARGLSARPYVLVPGGLHFRKNADLILAATPRLLERFPDLLLCVVNHSHPAYAASARALGDRVRLLGFVSDAALHALYAGAAAVWFPSRYEGFGMPVLEAMASGAPVVASDASSLPEIAGGAALLADVSRPASHLERLEALLCDGGLRRRLKASGRERAAAFTWERSAAQMAQLFQELARA